MLAQTNTETPDIIDFPLNEFPLNIGYYTNITTNFCRLKTFRTELPPPHQSCFRWHKTIMEQQSRVTTIKDGRLAKFGEVPYTVYINSRRGSCTGAIISELWIITAKHCVTSDVNSLIVYSGNNVYRYPRDNKKVIKALNVWRHSSADLALIKLSKKIVPNADIPNANTVCLPAYIWPNRYHIDKPVFGLLSGWGYVDDYTENTSGLKVLVVKINRYFGTERIISDEISFGFACRGDSGPLVQYVNGRAVLIGIFSAFDSPELNGKMCGDVTEMKFVSATYFMKWIRDTILSNQ